MNAATAASAYLVAEYVRALPRFEIWEARRSSHMGEVLANSILQAGVSYRRVVAPRLARIRSSYPEAVTVGAFQGLLARVGAHDVLLWKHDEKPRRLCELTDFMHAEGADTGPDFARWLRHSSNRERLLRVRGVGPKTIDYLATLVGVPAVAVDRHVRSFAVRAGVRLERYDELKWTFEFAADLLGIRRDVFDYSVWRYESEPQLDLFASTHHPVDPSGEGARM